MYRQQASQWRSPSRQRPLGSSAFRPAPLHNQPLEELPRARLWKQPDPVYFWNINMLLKKIFLIRVTGNIQKRKFSHKKGWDKNINTTHTDLAVCMHLFLSSSGVRLRHYVTIHPLPSRPPLSPMRSWPSYLPLLYSSLPSALRLFSQPGYPSSSSLPREPLMVFKAKQSLPDFKLDKYTFSLPNRHTHTHT